MTSCVKIDDKLWIFFPFFLLKISYFWRCIRTFPTIKRIQKAMRSIIVLGAGMVGSAMALDLAKIFSVTSADIDQEALDRLAARNGAIQTRHADLSDAAVLTDLVKPFDIVVSAVPGFMGFVTLRTLIEAEKDVIDIAFFS